MKIGDIKTANIFSYLLFIITLVCPVLAHNTSWNKAVIAVSDNRVSLSLRIVQVDLLGAAAPEKDSSVALSHDEWRKLLPRIREYVFNNLSFSINGSLVSAGIDDNWRVENSYAGVEGIADTLMGVIEINRSWEINGSIERCALTLNLLQNVDVPVKWVVLISSKEPQGKRSYKIASRGETVFYNFKQHAWIDSSGVLLTGRDESTFWGRLIQFVTIGFNHISLEKIFKSTERPHVIIVYLLIAILIGAFHALSPGHGKALIGAYIIGIKGTVTDAVILGVVTAVSHTISVLILGTILLIAFDSVVPDDITAYLNAVSGLLISIIGIYLLYSRLKKVPHDHHTHSHHTHDHESHPHTHDDHEHTHNGRTHDHAHTHDHDHEHPYTHDSHTTHDLGLDHSHDHSHQHITMESIQKKGIWTNIMMGISGGMVPCPTALVVLFLAISLKKLALGLLLIVFFSFGLALTLTVLGILFAKGSKLIDRYDSSGIVQKLPVISAGIIVVLGLVIMIRGLLSV